FLIFTSECRTAISRAHFRWKKGKPSGQSIHGTLAPRNDAMANASPEKLDLIAGTAAAIEHSRWANRLSRHRRQPDRVAGLSALRICAAGHRGDASCRGRTQRWSRQTRAVRPLSYARQGPRRTLVG